MDNSDYEHASVIISWMIYRNVYPHRTEKKHHCSIILPQGEKFSAQHEKVMGGWELVVDGSAYYGANSRTWERSALHAIPLSFRREVTEVFVADGWEDWRIMGSVGRTHLHFRRKTKEPFPDHRKTTPSDKDHRKA